MAYLLMTYFGQQEEETQITRKKRTGWRQLLGASTGQCHIGWIFCYTMFVDRDGKFQLGMLSTSAFKPLAASMGPMLKKNPSTWEQDPAD